MRWPVFTRQLALKIPCAAAGRPASSHPSLGLSVFFLSATGTTTGTPKRSILEALRDDATTYVFSTASAFGSCLHFWSFCRPSSGVGGFLAPASGFLNRSAVVSLGVFGLGSRACGNERVATGMKLKRSNVTHMLSQSHTRKSLTPRALPRLAICRPPPGGPPRGPTERLAGRRPRRSARCGWRWRNRRRGSRRTP